jgi:hypothetical protein
MARVAAVGRYSRKPSGEVLRVRKTDPRAYYRAHKVSSRMGLFVTGRPRPDDSESSRRGGSIMIDVHEGAKTGIEGDR